MVSCGITLTNMAEPTATLYDNHNDNSVDTAKWTEVNAGNADTTEAGSSYMQVNAPGTGGADVDDAIITSDTPGVQGLKCLALYNEGASYNFGRVGITDTVANSSKAWTGNYISIMVGVNSGSEVKSATLSTNGYSAATTNNSPIALNEDQEYTFKIYEGGDGNIYVYIDASLLAVIPGNILPSSFIKYTAASATDGTRHFYWRVNDTYTYADNPSFAGGVIII